MRKPKQIITDTIMKNGGLTDFDREYVEADAGDIIKNLKKEGYKIVKKENNSHE